MVRRQTWLVVIALVALISYAAYLNDQKKNAPSTATPAAESVFVIDAAEGLPASIEVKSNSGLAVKLMHDNNAWALELPEKAEADQGSAEAAATQVTALKVIDPVTGDPSIFGVDKPVYVITVELTGGKKHVLEVGDNTPTNTGYYVRVDADKIFIVGMSGIDSLTGLITTPPYLNTPTPAPTPLPPATPTPPPLESEVTVTPTP